MKSSHDLKVTQLSNMIASCHKWLCVCQNWQLHPNEISQTLHSESDVLAFFQVLLAWKISSWFVQVFFKVHVTYSWTTTNMMILLYYVVVPLRIRCRQITKTSAFLIAGKEPRCFFLGIHCAWTQLHSYITLHHMNLSYMIVHAYTFGKNHLPLTYICSSGMSNH